MIARPDPHSGDPHSAREIVPLLPLGAACLRGAAGGAVSAVLSGRKPDLVDLAVGCLSGGFNKAPGIFKAAGSGKKPRKPPQNFVPPSNPPQPPPQVPPGWTCRPTNSGGGTIYQQPGSIKDANSIRVMPPGADPNYPNGYWQMRDAGNNPINPATNKSGPPHDTHVPLPPGYFQ